MLDAIRENADRHAHASYRDREKQTLTNTEIGELLPCHKLVLGALVQVLAGHHLIEPVSGGLVLGQWGGGDRWAITTLGRALLAQLDDAAPTPVL